MKIKQFSSNKFSEIGHSPQSCSCDTKTNKLEAQKKDYSRSFRQFCSGRFIWNAFFLTDREVDIAVTRFSYSSSSGKCVFILSLLTSMRWTNGTTDLRSVCSGRLNARAAYLAFIVSSNFPKLPGGWSSLSNPSSSAFWISSSAASFFWAPL